MHSSEEARGEAMEEYPTTAGPADYALWLDGKWLGVAEAKKLTIGPAGVRACPSPEILISQMILFPRGTRHPFRPGF